MFLNPLRITAAWRRARAIDVMARDGEANRDAV